MRDGYFTHEKLARLFVMAMYAAGTLLTLLLAVEALRWGFLASFGRWRMLGLLFSFTSAGLLLSRLLAGRYGNRLAARLLPRRSSTSVKLESTAPLMAVVPEIRWNTSSAFSFRR